MNLSNTFLALVGFVSFTCLAITAHADPTPDLHTAMKAELTKNDAPSPTSGKVCTFTVQGLPGKFSDSTAANIAAENAGIGTPVLIGTCVQVRTQRTTASLSPARTKADKATAHDKVGKGFKPSTDVAGPVILPLTVASL